MTIVFLLFVVFISCVGTNLATDQAAMASNEALASQLTSTINKFSAKLYEESSKVLPNTNLVMSGLSAEIALSMLSLGARANTLEEMNRALFVPNVEFTKTAFKPVIEQLQSVDGVTLKIANKLFIKDGPAYVLSDEYNKSVIDTFRAGTENVDFAQSKAASKTINTWVENETNNKIKDLISEDSLNSDTRLVIVNAVYFKGDWEHKFLVEETRKRDFFLNAKDKVEVDMMHQTKRFRYAALPELNAQIVELPYKNKAMSMVIILPNEVEGLGVVEKKLAEGFDLTEAFKQMHQTEVNLALPKFKIETTLNLKTILPRMGFENLFLPGKSNLKGLLKTEEDLYISDAIQKAFIEVNEEGAEAAAATGLVATFYSLVIPKVFKVDHPFYFAIVSHNSIVFSGKVLKA